MAGFVLSLGVSVLHRAEWWGLCARGSKGRGERETASQRGDGSGQRGRQLSKGRGWKDSGLRTCSCGSKLVYCKLILENFTGLPMAVSSS